MEYHVDVAVIGASTGGTAAALAALQAGCSVLLTEETDWIGGQFTSQAVPGDEHRWIEEKGAARNYRIFRNRIRDYYSRNFPLTKRAQNDKFFNPGNAAVGRLSADPRVAVAVLDEMLMPYLFSGRLTLLLKCRLTEAAVEGDKIDSVTVYHKETGDLHQIKALYYLDGTDTGEMLPLSGAEYVTGAESKLQTGELHAPETADPLDMQAVTRCFAVDYIPGEDFTIEKPQAYEFWKNYQADYWPGKQLGMVTPHHVTHQPLNWSLFGENGRDMFQYRRILDISNFSEGEYKSDVTIINVPQTDYFLGPVIECEDAESHLQAAGDLSLSFLYWLQTEAVRPDGKIGYRGLRLRKDVVGTSDGLAKAVYIRESRRIKAEFTILEEHVGKEARGSDKAEEFRDSVGIGAYRIDLHPSTGNRNYLDIDCLPFQIPLGSLIPVRMENMLPACKNIGTTHITNGCYRLHPVEWTIGEAAGHLAAFCISRGYIPREVRNTEEKLHDFQKLLMEAGIELSW
nr:FAD-dependent oxidoreductase [uncultured Acetatifactor sp.]